MESVPLSAARVNVPAMGQQPDPQQRMVSRRMATRIVLLEEG
jgi:hypothetical protein